MVAVVAYGHCEIEDCCGGGAVVELEDAGAECETLGGEISELRATNAAQGDRILLLQMEVSLVRASLHEEALLRGGHLEQARALAYGLVAKTEKAEAEALLLAAEGGEVRAKNVEQEIKILQLFDLIAQLLAEVGRRRAPVVEEEAGAEEGARSVVGLGVTVNDYVAHPVGPDGIGDEGNVHSAGQDGPAGLDDTDDEGDGQADNPKHPQGLEVQALIQSLAVLGERLLPRQDVQVSRQPNNRGVHTLNQRRRDSPLAGPIARGGRDSPDIVCQLCKGFGHEARLCRDLVCMQCHKFGHNEIHCRELLPIPKCQQCGKMGHTAKECEKTL